MRSNWLRAALSGLMVASVWQAPAESAAEPDVTYARISLGELRGATSANGRAVAFKGIPYAAPPTGPQRWKPPQPAIAWSGVRDTTAFGPSCPQAASRSNPFDPAPRMLLQSEDCLFLNVWTPTHRPSDPMPVVVWIYGGSFVGGSSSLPTYDGATLAADGVVVVTLNYRVGVLGFLAHPALTAASPEHASGNYWLLDEIAALTWVRDNIAAFGGDPAQVTVAGHSAGGISVSLLMASPLARGLFVRAIVQSGPIEGLAPPTRSLATAQAGGEALMLANGVRTLAAMRDLPVSALLTLKRPAAVQPGVQLGPVIDGYSLVEQPADTYAAGHEAPVPLLIGTTSGESGSMTDTAPTPQSIERFGKMVFRDDSDRVLALYPYATEAEARASQSRILTERILAGTLAQAACHARIAPTYVYRWDHRPLMGDAAWRGAYHGVELPYLFGTLDGRNLPYGAGDRRMATMMRRDWLSFVRTGRPADTGWATYRGEATMRRLALSTDPATPVPAADRLAQFFTPGDPHARSFGPPSTVSGPCA